MIRKTKHILMEKSREKKLKEILSLLRSFEYPIRKFSKPYPEIKTVSYTGGRFPFESKQLSIAISNAVIEHVGDYEAQLRFVNEMIRVGHQIYFTTPTKEFPSEIHTNLPIVYWFPKPMLGLIVTLFGKR